MQTDRIDSIEDTITAMEQSPRWAPLLSRRTAAEGSAAQRLRDVIAAYGRMGDRRPWRDLVAIVGEEEAEAMVQHAIGRLRAV